MIGKLTFIDGSEAVLGDDLVWSSKDATVARALNTLYPVTAAPWNGKPGVADLYKAGAKLGSVVFIEDRPGLAETGSVVY